MVLQLDTSNSRITEWRTILSMASAVDIAFANTFSHSLNTGFEVTPTELRS